VPRPVVPRSARWSLQDGDVVAGGGRGGAPAVVLAQRATVEAVSGRCYRSWPSLAPCISSKPA
jgi:hypothetical protein